MSDTSQGTGWWLASDGKWYPPESKPLYAPPPPPSSPGLSSPDTPPAPVGDWQPPEAKAPATPGWWAPYPNGYPPSYGAARTASGGLSDERTGLSLAPWWKRLVAILIDFLILVVAYVVIGLVCAIAGLSHLYVILLASAADCLYYASLNGSAKGQTVGKMAMSIACRDSRTGGRIGFWRGLGRYVIELVFEIAILIPLLIDNLAPLWDRRRQAWHDHIVGSIVVETGK